MGIDFAEALMERVDEVDAPIGHRAAGVIPEIAEGGEGRGLDAPAVRR